MDRRFLGAVKDFLIDAVVGPHRQFFGGFNKTTFSSERPGQQRHGLASVCDFTRKFVRLPSKMIYPDIKSVHLTHHNPARSLLIRTSLIRTSAARWAACALIFETAM
jgi:hypothetical protein